MENVKPEDFGSHLDENHKLYYNFPEGEYPLTTSKGEAFYLIVVKKGYTAFYITTNVLSLNGSYPDNKDYSHIPIRNIVNQSWLVAKVRKKYCSNYSSSLVRLKQDFINSTLPVIMAKVTNMGSYNMSTLLEDIPLNVSSEEPKL